jgi:hypothetical protein
MRKAGPVISVLTILLSALLQFSCDGRKDNADKFLIKVDSIQIPAEATMNIPFSISFFGTIGTNGCYSFSNLVMNHSGHEIEIEAWGIFENSGEACPDVMVYLTGFSVNVTIDYPGEYKIKVMQPDGSFIEKIITVYYDLSGK